MRIERGEVRRIAELARLELPEDGVERVAEQLSQVLDFVATLDALDLSDCEPSTFAPADAPLRPDEPNGRRLEEGAATSGTTESEYGFFLVPPVVENLEP